MALLPLLRWEVYFNTLYSHMLVFEKKNQRSQQNQTQKTNKPKQQNTWLLHINHSYSKDFNSAVSIYIQAQSINRSHKVHSALN